MSDFNRKDGITLSSEDIADLIVRYPQKYLWFAQRGYKPHYWQILFHSNTNPQTGLLTRFRHLAAGRRGGKTMAAAEDVVFYMVNPSAFHRDYHGTESERPLLGWVVTADYPMGLWSLIAVREALREAGLKPNVDYKENLSNRWFEFKNGSFLLFKTADAPNRLRGAGLDILWFDESAMIADEIAFDAAYPALGDKLGMFISTTTPDGKNWHWEYFWNRVLGDSEHAHIEYWSIDNPYYPTSEWMKLKNTWHPMLFKREFMASFDAMAGKELSGEWLHYYEEQELDDHRTPEGSLDLNVYVGVDPAISLADSADRFVITAIGVTKDRSQAYLLDQWAGRIPFPEQVDKIAEWYRRWKPFTISIEKTAYQAALAQQVQRLEGFPPVSPIRAQGKKSERILAMSQFFRLSRILIKKEHIDFISEWVDYDSEKKNPHDDCLDSVEITLRGAGVFIPGQSLPEEPTLWLPDSASYTSDTWGELAAKQYAKVTRPKSQVLDETYGEDW